MKFNHIYILIALLSYFQVSYSQDLNTTKEHFFNKNIDYQVRTQFSIGGTAPLGIPREIRKIQSYNPTLQLGVEANATKWFSNQKDFGLRIGVRFEGQGMKTRARVKDYRTEINYNGALVKGHFTGKVKTNIRNTYITLPVLAVYNLNSNFNLYGGVYFSGLIDKTFNGKVSDGYLRQGDPTGQKILFDNEKTADYDFSEEVRRFQWGTQVGGEYKMNDHFRLFADMTYGFNGVMKSDFDAISFSMHNIHLNLGFGYKF